MLVSPSESSPRRLKRSGPPRSVGATVGTGVGVGPGVNVAAGDAEGDALGAGEKRTLGSGKKAI